MTSALPTPTKNHPAPTTSDEQLPIEYAEAREKVGRSRRWLAGGLLQKKQIDKDVTLAHLKKEIEMDEHKLSIDDLCTRLGTNTESGLTTEVRQDLLHLENSGAPLAVFIVVDDFF
jgi:SOS response regulatory protein OraA/RecX